MAAPVHVIDQVGDKRARCGADIWSGTHGLPHVFALFAADRHPQAWCETCWPAAVERERICCGCRQMALIGERGLCTDCVHDRRGD